MLDKIKINLRLSNNAFDIEIIGLINACIADLRIAGLTVSNYTSATTSFDNALIDSAVIAYVKANFGLTYNADYEKVYNYIKTALVLGGGQIE